MESYERRIKELVKNGQSINIAVVEDKLMWHEKFLLALKQQMLKRSIKFSYDLVNLDKNNWIKVVQPFDVVVWKPFCLGPETTSQFKEKIYFMNKYLGKYTMPNIDTIWHYDSKIAQSYIFEIEHATVPQTIITHDFEDATNIVNQITYPVVCKKSWGASSSNVELLQNMKEAKTKVKRIFFQDYWDQFKKKGLLEKVRSFGDVALWEKFYRRLFWSSNIDLRFPYLYLQEFLAGNDRDLRVTVIGNKYAYAFWRNNRKNDFRASGSGSIDYCTVVPEQIMKELMMLNESLNFDSMAYDILFDQNSYKIVEMSYAYVDTAIYNAPGYYEKINNGIVFREAHTWPQMLWIEWMFCNLSL